ncbi:MAG: Ti-type conjugative transfer system protein TraG [Pseudorhizobium sp.]
MTGSRTLLLVLPPLMMVGLQLAMNEIEFWIAGFSENRNTSLALGRLGLGVPFAAAAVVGVIFLFAAKGSALIHWAGRGVFAGGALVAAIGLGGEAFRLFPLSEHAAGFSVLHYLDLYTMTGVAVAFGCALFGLKVAIWGNGAFGNHAPRQVFGSRAIHGDSNWMSKTQASLLFPSSGDIVIGERYRPDKDRTADVNFSPRQKETWGKGGTAPLLGFDAGFGSTHGLVFAGSGGFKTTSVVIPTALTFKGSLVLLDPSTEVAPMVAEHRRGPGQMVWTLDPKTSQIGFNVLDWIGQHGNRPEEDIASVAAWLMSEKPRITSGSDDFFRTSAEQLITAVIADVMLQEDLSAEANDNEDVKPERTLRYVRHRLAQPEGRLQAKLQQIFEHTTSRFVREVVAPFINMTPQTFSGVYATATKETHWLSYDNYAALVSGNSFKTDSIAEGITTVLINIDLSTLENHPGLARVIIGALLKAIYNRQGKMNDRALFLLDEAARLGYMRIIETARDAGRKYGITLLMLFQSLGQMREAFGGRDATSKWFESSSWVSFAAINDTETAEYVSKRCGMTTVEVDQLSRTSRESGYSRTRSRQLSQRPLILPHEVMRMRGDEQIIFTSGQPPIRAGRAIYFRRPEMLNCIKGKRRGG